MSKKILRRAEVERRTGLSRSTLYAAIKRGTFPKPLKLTKRAVGWLESEVLEWIDAKASQSRDSAHSQS